MDQNMYKLCKGSSVRNQNKHSLSCREEQWKIFRSTLCNLTDALSQLVRVFFLSTPTVPETQCCDKAFKFVPKKPDWPAGCCGIRTRHRQLRQRKHCSSVPTIVAISLPTAYKGSSLLWWHPKHHGCHDGTM